MAPGIIQGDKVFAQMRYNCLGCKTKVQYGDVIIYIDPNDPTLYKISRVIGLPKDRIEINGRHIEPTFRIVAKFFVSIIVLFIF